MRQLNKCLLVQNLQNCAINQSINQYLFLSATKSAKFVCKKSKLCKIVVEMCNVVKIGKNMQSMQTWAKFAELCKKEGQSFAKCATLCKMYKIVQKVQTCAKCTMLWKMFKIVHKCKIWQNVQCFKKCAKLWKCEKFCKYRI